MRSTFAVRRSAAALLSSVGLGASSRFSTSAASSSAGSESTSLTADVVVVGGGSGGIAFAKRAASYGASVVIVEGKEFGGTCVNVGCVPKKIMFNASHVAETIKEAHQFAFRGVSEKDVDFDWGAMKKYRDRYIGRLNTIYEDGLDKLKVTRVEGFGKLTSPTTVQVGDRVITAKHIVIAVGGAPAPLGVPGGELAIDSDGFFALEQRPKKVGVIGAGYIAVELAGVFNGCVVGCVTPVAACRPMTDSSPLRPLAVQVGVRHLALCPGREGTAGL